jgi:UDP-N-acetylmuramoyl-tripeptide--D-alanyl-D-alanine ligase
LHIGSETKFAVIEMGANHTGEIAQLCRMARPVESAVTMVGPAHLEGFGDIAAVARAKSEIMEALPGDGCFYVNADDAFCAAMGERFPGEKVFFGKRGDVALESLHFDDSGEMVLHIAPIGQLRLPLMVRAHSINVLLAVAVGLRHGIADFEEPLRAACKSASRFKVIQLGSCTLLDDTYNANPASMKAALEALADYSGKRKIAVLGDMFELGEAAACLHAEVGTVAAQQGIDCLFSLGAYAKDMVGSASAAGIPEAFAFENHESLAAAIQEHAEAGDTILFKGSRGMKMELIIQQLQSAVGGCA